MLSGIGYSTRHASVLKELNVRDFVLPFDVEDSVEATQVEVVELSSVPHIDHRGLTSIYEWKKTLLCRPLAWW